MYRRIYFLFYITLSLLFILSCESTRNSSEEIQETSKTVQKIQWPDQRYSSIQSAIDALEDGGRLELASGKFELTEPLVVTGKNITIEGSPSDRKIPMPKWEETRPVIPSCSRHLKTQLIGPRTKSLIRDEEAKGVINFIKAGGVVKNLELSGFDAGIISLDGKGSESDLIIDNAIIKNTGRGILFESVSSLTVGYCQICDVIGDGISYEPSSLADDLISLIAYNIIVKDVGSIGIKFKNSFGTCIHNSLLGGCEGGCIVGHKSGFDVISCIIGSNRNVGIAYIESYGWVIGNIIYDTYPRLSDSLYGDAISVILRGLSQSGDKEIPVKVFNNHLLNNKRVGISNFGGNVVALGNRIECSDIYLNCEQLLGKECIFKDIGQNVCFDCTTNQEVVCVKLSAGLSPIPPLE